MLPDKSKTSWGEVAVWYDKMLDDGNTYQKTLILPNLKRVLEVKPKERILDLACGNGFFAREIAGLGADVLGVDISSELIALAESKGRLPNLSFAVSSAEKLSGLADNSFDKIFCVLAVQNMSDINFVLAESARILKKKGRLFLIMNHPAFRIAKKSAWGFDEKADIMYRRIDAYLSESRSEIVAHPGKDKSPKTVSFHRPLQSYFKALAKSNFLVEKFEEWNSDRVSNGRRAKAENRARKEIPLFLLIGAVKSF